MNNSQMYNKIEIRRYAKEISMKLFPIDISPGQSTPLITNYIPGTDGLAFTANWYGCQT